MTCASSSFRLRKRGRLSNERLGTLHIVVDREFRSVLNSMSLRRAAADVAARARTGRAPGIIQECYGWRCKDRVS
jgi:hypothetical protein